LRLDDLIYDLPPELIAQEPARPRDASRLLVLHRDAGIIEDRQFPDLLTYLSPRDAMVMNDTRVIPARLFATSDTTPDSKPLEVLLLRQESAAVWRALVKPGKKAKVGMHLHFGEQVQAEVLGLTEEGSRRLRFYLAQHDTASDEELKHALTHIGAPPLPPYITAPLRRPGDYQTVYAKKPGAVAAPTAGLHFTPHLLDQLRQQIHAVCSLTLHIGPATFRPIRTETVEEHPMAPEQFSLPESVTDVVNAVHAQGGRRLAIGTSTCRVLESCVDDNGLVHPQEGETTLFIKPGFRFRAVDILLTNFHLPKSTNLLLVMAFAGRENTLCAYQHAINERYRFFSFGDAMLII
jgi:S-adenosylmethionine:tRNA ribosyltransferase-isomerase